MTFGDWAGTIVMGAMILGLVVAAADFARRGTNTFRANRRPWYERGVDAGLMSAATERCRDAARRGDLNELNDAIAAKALLLGREPPPPISPSPNEKKGTP